MSIKSSLELIIHVDEDDNAIGSIEKIQAHKQALRHRAFSIMIYRNAANGKQWLLQQREKSKYHCGGLWTNSVCSHPHPNESTLDAAKRRLQEELGFTLPLHYCGKFHYISEFSNGLTENEIDHVFIGELQGQTIQPNPNEVQNIRWLNTAEIKAALKAHPEQFTPWFPQVLQLITD